MKVTDDDVRRAIDKAQTVDTYRGFVGYRLGAMRAALESFAATMPSPDPVLLKFYDVETWPDLVKAMEWHIEKLQAARPKKPWEDFHPPRIA